MSNSGSLLRVAVRRLNKRLLRVFSVACLLFSLAATPTCALTIIRQFTGGEQPTNAIGGNLIEVFNAACDMWELAIKDDHVLALEFGWAPVVGTFATHWLLEHDGARETRGRISFDNDLSASHFIYWLDPTPWSTEEFSSYQEASSDLGGGDIVAARFWRTALGTNLPGGDVMTAALHEIGHALGMSIGHPRWVQETADGSIRIRSPVPFAGTLLPLATNIFGVTSHLSYEGLPWGAVMQGGGDDQTRLVISGADILANAGISGWTNLNMSLAPPLQIAHSDPEAVTLHWSSPVPGWILETKDDAGPGPWRSAGATNPVTLRLLPGNCFFRLRK